jgi:hypothetical protein
VNTFLHRLLLSSSAACWRAPVHAPQI